MKRFLPWTLIGYAVVVAGYTANWPTIRFSKQTLGMANQLHSWILITSFDVRVVDQFLMPVDIHAANAPSPNQS